VPAIDLPIHPVLHAPEADGHGVGEESLHFAEQARLIVLEREHIAVLC
jgi:hypothetical protein